MNLRNGRCYKTSLLSQRSSVSRSPSSKKNTTTTQPLAGKAPTSIVYLHHWSCSVSCSSAGPSSLQCGNIAIKGIDGKYMRVTATNGLEFGTQQMDDNCKFTVKPAANGKIQLVGPNNKYMNMYYINDVKCEGTGGGLQVGILYLPEGQANLTISGYQGQDGRTAFLSSEAGSPDYKGSLAVKGIEDRTCRFTVQNL
ncbi:hypothetical protein C8J57DRAFT_1316945 [Mycena rebaudengoi]|nr:hypothetical protein C8J57DRAFT_1316945 [Mycena rebaudengoi]